MARHALLIGSQTAGLSGVHTDIDAMRSALAARGFQNDVRIEADASREGILDGYRKLIADAAADDAVVIYYSGHGGRAINPRYDPNAPLPKYLQFLVPTDFDAGGFRGILDLELSELQTQLTAKTRNVAAILDCCHAARMSRQMALGLGSIRPRALPRDWADGIEEHLHRVRPIESAGHAESNPYAVRLVATEADKSAYEYLREDGTFGGVMTESLVLVLEETGDLPVSWYAAGMRVRERVLSIVPEQRPDVEGPSQRIIFETGDANRTGAVVFFHDHGVPSLRAGRLIGSAVETEYGIMPLGADGYQREQEVARGTVVAVEGNVSRVRLEMHGGKRPLEDGALAFPVKVPFRKRRVRLIGSVRQVEALRADLNEATHLRVAGDEADVIATVQCHDGNIQVFDRLGLALTEPQPLNDTRRQHTLRILTMLAQADAMRTLESGGLDIDFRVAWGRVIDSQAVPMVEGDTFYAGDRLFVRLENAGDLAVYAAVFDIDIDGSVALLTNSEPTGIRLEPHGGAYWLGQKAGTLSGLDSKWKQGVPKNGPGHGTLVVIAAADRQEFLALETERRRGAIARQGRRSGLEHLLEQFRSGAKRTFDSEIDQAGTGTYFVKHIDFQVSPLPRPISGPRATP